jgi:hypothetical protein
MTYKAGEMTPKILSINPRGPGDLHGLRARRLAAGLDAEVTFHDIDRKQSYTKAMQNLWQLITSQHWDLIYQEGTGIGGGLPLIRAAKTRDQRFIVSSGDPIGGFFHVTKGPVVGNAFDLYERQLYRACAGFVGWTPYLTGAALTLGARRAATVEGAVDLASFVSYDQTGKIAAKEKYGLDPRHLVCGVVGSLRWTPRQSYCYGLELIETLKRVQRQDLSLLIVGDGSGLEILKSRIPDALRSRVIFTGRLPESEVIIALNAMDIGFITQTLDRLGSFRLTTKLPEYLACGLPVAMSPVPGFYDYASEAGWALPAQHPASSQFHEQCAAWLDQLTQDEVQAKSLQARPVAEKYFDYEMLIRRFRDFVHPLMGLN